MRKLDTKSDLCWICNKNKADSREHKFKKADLKKAYNKNNDLVYGQGIDSKHQYLQSVDSRFVKFDKVICHTCNTNITKKSDEAYDIFSNYIDLNYDYLLSNKHLDFNEIYPNHALEKKLSLYRYFAKHVGCKITTGFYEIPQDISKFVLGEISTLETLTFVFKLNADFYYLCNSLNFSNIRNGPTIYIGNEKNPDILFGWIIYQWLTIYWCVNENISSHKKVDFNKTQESLDVLLINDSFTDYKQSDEIPFIINLIENFGLETIEEKIMFAKSMIN